MNSICYSLTVWVGVLALSVLAVRLAPIPSGDKERVQAVMLRATELAAKTPENLPDYLAGLERDRDWQALAALAKADPKRFPSAAAAVVRILPAADAVAFCRTLVPKTLSWFEAFSTLSTKPKPAVIDYVIEIGRSKEPVVRAAAYRLCATSEWADLLADARRDTESDQQVVAVQECDGTETLGYDASWYRNVMGDLPMPQAATRKPRGYLPVPLLGLTPKGSVLADLEVPGSP